MKPIVSDVIRQMTPYEAGKPIEELRRELGGRWPGAGAIKLASNENPLGPSSKAVAAAQEALQNIARYPDSGWYYLRQDVASRLGLSASQLVFGAGSNELIDLIVQTYTEPGDEVLTFAYSFACYRLAAEAHRRRFREVAIGTDFSYRVEDLLRQIHPDTKVVFIANPNNPTGTYLPQAEYYRLLDLLPPEILLVIDEAYFEYATATDYPNGLSSLGKRERLIVLRTFSKIYGLAGLRVGYAVGAESIIGFLNRVRLPFNVNLVAQAAARAALLDSDHVAQSQTMNERELGRLAASLQGLDHQPYPSQGNFLLVRFVRLSAAAIHRQLLERGVIVRPMEFYHLPEHLRISVGRPDENSRLIQALEELA